MQTAHCNNSISPVELQYCLRTKIMLSEVTPMLLHRYLVSAVFFDVFGWHMSFVWRFLNGVIVKKKRRKHGKCSLCVR